MHTMDAMLAQARSRIDELSSSAQGGDRRAIVAADGYVRANR